MENDKKEENMIEGIECFANRHKITFVSTMIIGLCAHLYRFTNLQWNFDELSISSYGGYGTGITLGRWFLQYFGDFIKKITWNYSLPLFTGVISCILLSISACMIVDILQIKDKFLCILVSGLFISFPAITSMFFYMFTAGYYSLAIFLCVCAVYITHFGSHKWKYIISCLFITCSLGTYQAYFPIAVSLYLLLTIYYLLTNYSEKRILYKTFKLGIKYLLILVVSLAMYFVILKISLRISGQSLSDYRGVSSMGTIELTSAVTAIKNVYKDFIGLNFQNIYRINPTVISTLSLLVLNIIMMIHIILYIVNNRKYIMSLLGILFLLFLLPISCFLIYLMAPTTTPMALMLYPVVFAYVAPIAIIEWLKCYSKKIKFSKIAYLILPLLLLIYTWFSNANYVACNYTNYHDFAYMEVLVTQIKSIDGYNENMPVAFVGQDFSMETVNTNYMPLAELGGRNQSNLNVYSRLKLITRIIGFTPPMIEEQEQLDELSELTVVKEMPVYPNYGSIQIVDNVIVVKLIEK